MHVLQGEREQAANNKSLGRFDLSDIPPAPRGVPQVEVTFDIDANGILNVAAKDTATDKEQSIVIRASSGLGDDEIEHMVKDAEAHADEDRRFRDLVDAKNQAEGLIRATKKSVQEFANKMNDEEKLEIQSAIETLETATMTETTPRSRQDNDVDTNPRKDDRTDVPGRR